MKKVGFTCSCFDLFHAGHIMMLKESKSGKDLDYIEIYYNDRKHSFSTTELRGRIINRYLEDTNQIK